VKRISTRLAAVATVGVALALTPAALAQPPMGGGTSAPATQPRPQRIVIVNIAKVLRDYNKANFLGAEITKKREAYVKRVQAYRDQIAEVNKRFSAASDPQMKKQLQEEALGIQRKIEDVDREAQRELTSLSNDTIVRVYQEIKGVIFDIAKTNNLDMVLCYPAASKAEDENSPQVAQLMLQTPALIPFYHHGMDITEVVIKTLNARAPGYESAGKVDPAGATSPPMPPGK
jgi:Skp family chaperone for outer membrane proteins